jgi:hypothetical protein
MSFYRKALTQRELNVLNDRVNDILDGHATHTATQEEMQLVDKHYTFKVVQGIALDSAAYKELRATRENKRS